MSFGPLCMGFLLQKYSARKLLTSCLFALAISEFVFAWFSSYTVLKAIRFVQGGLFSALLAATMTYIAGAASNMRQALAYYVAASVLGGLSGRIIAGFLSEHISWQTFFVGIGVAFLLVGVITLRLPGGVAPKKSAVSVHRLLEVLRDRYVTGLFGVIMLCFFVMNGFINYVPFRLEEIDPTVGEAVISLFYLGFIVSFFVSSNAPRIADGLGGEKRAVLAGVVLVLCGILTAGLYAEGAIFFAVLLMTSGFFLQHATVSALLNRYAGDRAGDVNSLYVSFYYIGGTAGSYLPGLVYVSAGWDTLIISLTTVTVCAGLLAFRMRFSSDQRFSPIT